MNERDKELAVKCRLLTKHTGGIYTDSLQEFADLIRADEREAIIDEWWSIVQADLENGVKCLNEQAATKWRKEYPSMATFGEWLEARGKT
ncbi:hypothetical protein UFOVP38_1 [uncultured Caudovirales phage]|uniref:Uncharacterized protein n=1 Tax=uncultured Caudovirales phage TaxID=2100421 RepID=A0A6J5T703_9CAUD|nr:hypothetical protein UFOVP38_1 [uncultured Caudovirales phage]